MRTLIAVALVAHASQCPTPANEGIYEYTEGASTDDGCDTTITENFDNASVPEGEVMEEGPWVVTYDSAGSDKVGFFQIIDTSCSTADLIFNGEVFGGTRTGDNYSFGHDFFQNSSTSQRNSETGFQYTATVDSMVTETFDFTFDPATNSFSGTHDITSSADMDFNETDEWDPNETGLFSSMMYSETLTYLEGDGEFGEGNINLPEDPDCSGTNCNLNVSSSCTSMFPMTAHRTEASGDQFDYLSGVGQSSGF